MNTHTKYFKKGHPLHPKGCVIVIDNDQTPPTTTEYTLEQWQELQKSQQPE